MRMWMVDELLHVSANGRDTKHVMIWEVAKHVFSHGGVNAYGEARMKMEAENGITCMCEW